VWIIFGWEKIEKRLGEVGAAYCFDCQRADLQQVAQQASLDSFQMKEPA
jgi:hypothetical protein